VKRQIDTKVRPTKTPPDQRNERPGPMADTGGASKLNANADPQVRLSKHPAQIPIRAILVGSDHCDALGLTGHGYSPVLALCRALVAAGHDPRRRLHAYRGEVLALVVSSIGAGAKLRVATHGVGFEPVTGCTGGPPVRQNGPTILQGGSEGERACAATAKRKKLRASGGRRP
jgi:hypothetical protein